MSYQYKRLVDDSVEKISGNYIIECLPDHTFYSGKGADCLNRWEEHKRDLNAGLAKECPELLARWKKYGGEKAFKFTIWKRAQFSYRPGEMDAMNRYRELMLIYDLAPRKGITMLNKKTEHDFKLFLLLRFLIDECEYTVIACQRDVNNRVTGGKRLDLVYEDDFGNRHNIDLHDVDSSIFSEHKEYCVNNDIDFYHFDNGLHVSDKGKAMFTVQVDGFKSKPK